MKYNNILHKESTFFNSTLIIIKQEEKSSFIICCNSMNGVCYLCSRKHFVCSTFIVTGFDVKHSIVVRPLKR